MFPRPFARVMYCYPKTEQSIHVREQIGHLKKYYKSLEVNAFVFSLWQQLWL
jgi:hypothetical protein